MSKRVAIVQAVNNNNKLQKGKIIKCISYNTHDVKLEDGSIWKRNNDQLFISSTPSSNSISLTPAGQTYENLKSIGNNSFDNKYL
ncbi:hypothetical protein QTP88_008770 [Uroleucon formosanum]